MRLHPRQLLPKVILLLCACGGAGFAAAAQTPATPAFLNTCDVRPKPEEVKADAATPAGTVSAVRIEVKGADGNPVRRRRFFLLERGAQEAQGIAWNSAPRRRDYVTKSSPALNAWLNKLNCETAFCPEIDATFRDEKTFKELMAAGIPEFREAYDRGMSKYKNERLAREWMLINFPLRAELSRYFEARKNWLRDAEKKAGSVKSALTDDGGQAYFTDVPLKTYFVSNLLPLDGGDVIWNCRVVVPPPPKKEIASVTAVLALPKAPATAQPASK